MRTKVKYWRIFLNGYTPRRWYTWHTHSHHRPRSWRPPVTMDNRKFRGEKRSFKRRCRWPTAVILGLWFSSNQTFIRCCSERNWCGMFGAFLRQLSANSEVTEKFIVTSGYLPPRGCRCEGEDVLPLLVFGGESERNARRGRSRGRRRSTSWVAVVVHGRHLRRHGLGRRKNEHRTSCRRRRIHMDVTAPAAWRHRHHVDLFQLVVCTNATSKPRQLCLPRTIQHLLT